MLARRCERVLITLGGEGACLFSRQGAWRARVELAREMIRSTVGCGDAFLAAFIAAHQNGRDDDAALADATAVAAASAMSDMPASFSQQDYVNIRSGVIVEGL
jgi:6-phosphofructokinase 2